MGGNEGAGRREGIRAREEGGRDDGVGGMGAGGYEMSWGAKAQEKGRDEGGLILNLNPTLGGWYDDGQHS